MGAATPLLLRLAVALLVTAGAARGQVECPDGTPEAFFLATAAKGYIAEGDGGLSFKAEGPPALFWRCSAGPPGSAFNSSVWLGVEEVPCNIATTFDCRLGVEQNSIVFHLNGSMQLFISSDAETAPEMTEGYMRLWSVPHDEPLTAGPNGGQIVFMLANGSSANVTLAAAKKISGVNMRSLPDQTFQLHGSDPSANKTWAVKQAPENRLALGQRGDNQPAANLTWTDGRLTASTEDGDFQITINAADGRLIATNALIEPSNFVIMTRALYDKITAPRSPSPSPPARRPPPSPPPKPAPPQADPPNSTVPLQGSNAMPSKSTVSNSTASSGSGGGGNSTLSTPSPRSGGPNAGVIAGAVIGALVLVGALAAFAVVRARSQRASTAAARSAGAYEPGWSPEEMRGDMRALEEAAEGLLLALRGNADALDALAAAGLPQLGEGADGAGNRILEREARKSALFTWLYSFVWNTTAPNNWLPKGVDLSSAKPEQFRALHRGFPGSEMARASAPHLARHLARQLGLVGEGGDQRALGAAGAAALEGLVAASMLAWLRVMGCAAGQRITVEAKRRGGSRGPAPVHPDFHNVRMAVTPHPPYEDVPPARPGEHSTVLLTCKPGVVARIKARSTHSGDLEASSQGQARTKVVVQEDVVAAAAPPPAGRGSYRDEGGDVVPAAVSSRRW